MPRRRENLANPATHAAMQLSRVLLEHFRAIRRLDLGIGATCVLIGEETTGKPSIVDALAAASGFGEEATGFGFGVDDFRSTENGETLPIRVLLEFRGGVGQDAELTSGLPLTLAPALFRDAEGRRGMRLEVVARRGKGQVQVCWRFLDDRERTLADANQEAVLPALREAFPVVVIRGGFAYGNESLRQERGAPSKDRKHSLDRDTRERVRDLYRKILSARGADRLEEIPELFERIRSHLLELLDGKAPAWFARSMEAPWTEPTQETSSRIGILLLAGALFEARSRSHGDAPIRPILIVEDPESHLHPRLLSSVWHILELMEVQKLLTTNSETFVAEVPLEVVRRLERVGDEVISRSLRRRSLTHEDLRRVSYHVRLRRGEALFARCWLLVEGETEAWLMPGLALECGYQLADEGVCCVEFAQCGVVPVTKLAHDLGIEWHLLADGDTAGEAYVAQARTQLHGAREKDRITMLPSGDVERYLWDTGFADVFRRTACGKNNLPSKWRHSTAGPTIHRAIKRTSKPHMALEVLRSISEGRNEPPDLLRRAIATSVELTRRETPSK